MLRFSQRARSRTRTAPDGTLAAKAPSGASAPSGFNSNLSYRIAELLQQRVTEFVAPDASDHLLPRLRRGSINGRCRVPRLRNLSAAARAGASGQRRRRRRADSRRPLSSRLDGIAPTAAAPRYTDTAGDAPALPAARGSAVIFRLSRLRAGDPRGRFVLPAVWAQPSAVGAAVFSSTESTAAVRPAAPSARPRRAEQERSNADDPAGGHRRLHHPRILLLRASDV